MTVLECKKTFKNGKINKSIEERQLVFKLRTQVTNVKRNFKGMYEDFLSEIAMKRMKAKNI